MQFHTREEEFCKACLALASHVKKLKHEQKGTKVNFPRATSLSQQSPPRFTLLYCRIESPVKCQNLNTVNPLLSLPGGASLF